MSASAIYDAYCAWCEESGIDPAEFWFWACVTGNMLSGFPNDVPESAGKLTAAEIRFIRSLKTHVEETASRRKPRNPARNLEDVRAWTDRLTILGEGTRKKLRVPSRRTKRLHLEPSPSFRQKAWLPAASDNVTATEQRAAELLELRLRGLSMPACAKEMGLPLRTLERLWHAMGNGGVSK